MSTTCFNLINRGLKTPEITFPKTIVEKIPDTVYIEASLPGEGIVLKPVRGVSYDPSPHLAVRTTIYRLYHSGSTWAAVHREKGEH
jgi:hypothetical protein